MEDKISLNTNPEIPKWYKEGIEKCYSEGWYGLDDDCECGEPGGEKYGLDDSSE